MYVCVYIYIYIYIYIVIYIYIALPPQEVDLSPALKDATGEAFSYAKVIYGNLSQPSLPIYLYIYLSIYLYLTYVGPPCRRFGRFPVHDSGNLIERLDEP